MEEITAYCEDGKTFAVYPDGRRHRVQKRRVRCNECRKGLRMFFYETFVCKHCGAKKCTRFYLLYPPKNE